MEIISLWLYPLSSNQATQKFEAARLTLKIIPYPELRLSAQKFLFGGMKLQTSSQIVTPFSAIQHLNISKGILNGSGFLILARSTLFTFGTRILHNRKEGIKPPKTDPDCFLYIIQIFFDFLFNRVFPICNGFQGGSHLSGYFFLFLFLRATKRVNLWGWIKASILIFSLRTTCLEAERIATIPTGRAFPTWRVKSPPTLKTNLNPPFSRQFQSFSFRNPGVSVLS